MMVQNRNDIILTLNTWNEEQENDKNTSVREIRSPPPGWLWAIWGQA